MFEMALASTVFLAMLIGVFEMMLALSTFNYVTDAARQGTRYAMVRGSTSCTNTPNLANCNATAAEVKTYVRGISYPGVNSSNLTVTTSWLSASTSPSSLTSGQTTTWSACGGTCNSPGNLVKVVTSYPFSFSVPFVPRATLTMTSTSQVVIAQ